MAKMARKNPRRVLLVFILELVIVLFIVVLVLIIFILVIIVLIVFILIVVIVSVFVIVHKNHPAFGISFCCLRGDYSLFYIK